MFVTQTQSAPQEHLVFPRGKLQLREVGNRTQWQAGKRVKSWVFARSSLMRLSSTVRAVALLEAAKGALVLLAGFGALSLIHHDAGRLAEQLVGHLHLNPAKHYPRIFIDAAAHLTDARLWVLATFAGAYGLVRFVEAYGLWRGRRWAEWFAAVSGGVYIPFELYELFQGVTWLSLGALVVNIVVVGLMINVLLRAH